MTQFTGRKIRQSVKSAAKILLLPVCFLVQGCSHSLDEKKAALKHASDIRIQKVVTRLQEDCEASLQKETYKISQQPRQPKRRPIARKKG